jgi:hypothetical protein
MRLIRGHRHGGEFHGGKTAMDTQPTWLTLVLSSALVSALVNAATNLWIDSKRRKHEEAKSDDVRSHVYLDVALQLEAFAKRTNARLTLVSEALAELYEHHDDSHIEKLVSFSFTFDPPPNWNDLPVAFVAKVKALPSEFLVCDEWIKEAWSLWADLGDVAEFEQERLAWYGLKALDLAQDIRRDIGVDPANDSIRDRRSFKTALTSSQSRFGNNDDQSCHIPELRPIPREPC